MLVHIDFNILGCHKWRFSRRIRDRDKCQRWSLVSFKVVVCNTGLLQGQARRWGDKGCV